MAGTATSETWLFQVLLRQLTQKSIERAPVAGEEGVSMMAAGSSSDPAPGAEELLFLHQHPQAWQGPAALTQGGSADRACIDKHLKMFTTYLFVDAYSGNPETPPALCQAFGKRALLEIACCVSDCFLQCIRHTLFIPLWSLLASAALFGLAFLLALSVVLSTRSNS